MEELFLRKLFLPNDVDINDLPYPFNVRFINTLGTYDCLKNVWYYEEPK